MVELLEEERGEVQPGSRASMRPSPSLSRVSEHWAGREEREEARQMIGQPRKSMQAEAGQLPQVQVEEREEALAPESLLL